VAAAEAEQVAAEDGDLGVEDGAAQAVLPLHPQRDHRGAVERADDEDQQGHVGLVAVAAVLVQHVGAAAADVEGDVVVRAALHALGAQRAVLVLVHRAHELVGRARVAAVAAVEAVLGLAAAANFVVAAAQLEHAHHRVLAGDAADEADVAAHGLALVDDEQQPRQGDHQDPEHRGEPRAVGGVEDDLEPGDQREQDDRRPHP
jgi:hypothetical protein